MNILDLDLEIILIAGKHLPRLYLFIWKTGILRSNVLNIFMDFHRKIRPILGFVW